MSTPTSQVTPSLPTPRREPWGKWGVAILVFAVLLGGVLRGWDIGGPSFSDDEIFKVNAVEKYREGQWTLTGDDEHPLAMKLLIYAAYGVRDLWNTHVAAGDQAWELGLESATRGPNAIIGAFIALVLAFLARELFSRRVGLIAALLWAVEVNVIGYNRIAKEDTLMTFFLLLMLYFVVRAKRSAEAGDHAQARRSELWTAVMLGGYAATKYYLHLLFVVPLFYWLSRKLAGSTWHVPMRRWFQLIGISLLVFFAINPTVLHPANLSYIVDYIGHKTVFTHGYLFNGDLYMNNIFEGLSGTPWYYYFTYLWLKLPIPLLAMVIVGLGVAFARRKEDGARLLFVYLAMWFLVHAFLSGAKWGRFVVHLMPPIVLLAALGVDVFGRWAARLYARARRLGDAVQAAPARRFGAAVAGVVGAGVFAAATATAIYSTPNHKMYLNAFGGSAQNLRHYFPHCDFYDVGLREAVQFVCARAEPGAQLRTDANVVGQHYLNFCDRPDIKLTTLSKPQDGCEPGRPCYQILQVGRTYYETLPLFRELYGHRNPDAVVRVNGVNVAEVYGPTPSPTPALAIRHGAEAIRLGALARKFGNKAAGEFVASTLPVPREARPEHAEPRRLASVTNAFRFAGDVVVETIEARAPSTDTQPQVQ